MIILQRFCFVRLVILLLALGLFSGRARSESDLEKAIRQYNAETVKGYIQPIADFFGANMNAGFGHTAKVPVSGFHFKLEIVAMGSAVGDDQKTYKAKDPWGGQFSTATIMGGKGGRQHNPGAPADTNSDYRGSDGIINTTLFPFLAPQVTIGHIYGTEAMIRYVPIPEIDGGKFPKITLFGIGARHSISQYLGEEPPVDIAASIMYNHFTVGDLITAKTFALGVQASRDFSVLVLYGGFQYESSTMNLQFKSTDPTVTTPLVSIDMDGANKFRATIGAGLNLSVLHLFADANFGTITNYSAGIGFGF